MQPRIVYQVVDQFYKQNQYFFTYEEPWNSYSRPYVQQSNSTYIFHTDDVYNWNHHFSDSD